MEYEHGMIVVVSGLPEDYKYYSNGDKAKLTHIDITGDWWADFNGLGNESVYGCGKWCIGDNTDKSDGRFNKSDYASDGSTASYYELPEGATELQDLISFRNMNAQLGEIQRAVYRYGLCSHSDKMRDIKKIIFYAQAELERLEKYEKD